MCDVGDIMHADTFEDIPLFSAPERTRAFLKIQEGCQNFCSYCIIPYTRGPLRSRSVDSIRREAEKLLKAGFREIVLTGIHLGAYGRDLEENVTLADAAAAVLEFPELKRLRLGSLESIELSPELFELIRNDKRFARHLHLPLQAGSDAILKTMNRHYNAEEFSALLEKVRAEVPGVAITTDIIVGFPGETEEDFQETLDVVRKAKYDSAFTFIYSKRSGTPAAKMPDQVSEEVVHERFDRLLKVVNETAREQNGKLAGNTELVLVEEIDEKDASMVTGRLSNNSVVHFKGDASLIGKIVPVVLEESKGFYYLGRLSIHG